MIFIFIIGGSERYSSRGGRGEHSNSYKRPRVCKQINYKLNNYVYIKLAYIKNLF